MAWGRIPPSGVNRFKLAHGNEENDLATFLENKSCLQRNILINLMILL